MKHGRDTFIPIEECIFTRQRDGAICTVMTESDRKQRVTVHSNISEARVWVKRMHTELRSATVPTRLSRTRIDDAVRTFLSLKNVAESSLSAYRAHFARLARFLQERNIIYMHEFTKQIRIHLVLYLKSPAAVLAGTPTRGDILSPNTQRAHLVSFMDFFNWACENDYIHDTPFRGFRLKKHVKRSKPVPDYYRPHEIEAFFKATYSEAHRRLFRALYLSGLRASEIANLEWEDIDLTAAFGPVLHVVPRPGAPLKSESSERDIPIAGELEVLLRDIIKNPLSPERPFCNEWGGKLSRRSIYEICTRIGERAGITSQVTAHKWRHTFSSVCIQKRIPLSQLQQLLGHADITTTMVYAHDKPPTESETRQTLAEIFAEED